MPRPRPAARPRLLAAALLALAGAAAPALAFAPAEGTFVAERDCPATASIRSGENPGGVRLAPGAAYPLVGLNAPGGSHALVVVEGAQPARRWVARDCGTQTLAGDAAPAARAASGFAPIFGRGGPPAPRLTAFEEALLGVCGDWGSRPSRAAFRALLDRPDFAAEARALEEALAGPLARATGRPLDASADRFRDALAALWFAEDGFRHVFCGEPREDGIGGLHWRGRLLALEREGWGGRADCRAASARPPVYELGLAFRTPSGATEVACPKSVAIDLDAAAILVAATRAHAALAPTRAGTVSCLVRVEGPSGAAHVAVYVARDGAVRTFYPDLTPTCRRDGRSDTCFCDD